MAGPPNGQDWFAANAPPAAAAPARGNWFAANAPAASPVPQGTLPNNTQGHSISAQPAGLDNYLGQVESDIKYGGNSTVIGRILHAVGMQPTGSGPGSQMLNPVGGAVRLTRGLTDLMGDAGKLSPVPAIRHASTGAPIAVAGNRVIGGAMQAAGPKMLGVLADTPVEAGTTMAAQAAIQKVLEAAGASPQTAQFISSIMAVGGAGAIHSSPEGASEAKALKKIVNVARPAAGNPEFAPDLQRAAGNIAEAARRPEMTGAHPKEAVRGAVAALKRQLSAVNSERDALVGQIADQPFDIKSAISTAKGAITSGMRQNKPEEVAATIKELDRLAGYTNGDGRYTVGDADSLRSALRNDVKNKYGKETNATVAAKKALRMQLVARIDAIADANGLPSVRELGIQEHALDNFHDVLENRINVAERQGGPLSTLLRGVRFYGMEDMEPLGGIGVRLEAARDALTGRGPNKDTQTAMATLAGSRLQPGESVATLHPSGGQSALSAIADALMQRVPRGPAATPEVAPRLQLGAGATPLPGEVPAPTPPPVDYRTVEDRLGRLLNAAPAPAKPLPASALDEPQMQVLRAKSITVRDPKTGRMKRIFLTSPAEDQAAIDLGTITRSKTKPKRK